MGWGWRPASGATRLGAVVALAFAAGAGGVGGGHGVRPGGAVTPTVSSPAGNVSRATTASPVLTPTAPVPSTLEPAASQVATFLAHGDPQKRVVALTFDDWFPARAATAILDTLAANHVRASFGLTGEWVTRYPRLARRIVDEGHVIINHTEDHRSLTGGVTGTPALSNAERADEITRAEAHILATTGVNPRPLFRPPWSETDSSMPADVGAVGYRYIVLSTVASPGWREGVTSDEIVAHCLRHAEPGAIYLLHLVRPDADALQRIIDGLRARDYGFVTIKQMLGAR